MTKRTLLVGLVDQATGSVSNVAVTVVAAQALGQKAFGGFALAFAVYLFVLGGARALATEPLLLAGRRAAGGVAGAAGAMLGLGLVAGCCCAVVGLLCGGDAGPALLALSPFLPLLLVQDGWRYSGFADEEPGRALAVDVVWVLALVVGIPILFGVGNPSAAALIVVWGSAGGVGALVGGMRTQTLPSVTVGVRWLRSNAGLGGPFLGEFLAAGGASNVGLWVLGLISGLSAVGAVRVGQTVFGPINVLYLGMQLVLVPAAVRHVNVDVGLARRTMVRASAVLMGVTALWTAAVVLAAPYAGRTLFGDTWRGAQPLLVPLGLALCAAALAVGAAAGLRALGAARASLRTRLTTTPLTVVLPLLGAVLRDELGFGVGLAISGWLTAIVWWSVFLRLLGRRGAGVGVSGVAGGQVSPNGSPAGQTVR